jgi:hypothetical protein
MKIIKTSIIILSLITFCQGAFASKGGLNKEGCHISKKTGDYHCHHKDKKVKSKKK